jgi:hypothetical protein
MSPDKDKRNFHRIFYNANASLFSETCSLTCDVIDISLNGCLLRFKQPWNNDLEHLYKLNLVLSGESSINMDLSVSHVIDDAVGFKCEHIDIDSITQLRRLVELNLGDSELLERDLLSLSNLEH